MVKVRAVLSRAIWYLLVLAPAALAADTLPTPSGMLSNVFWKIMSVFRLEWIKSDQILIGFLRLVLFITIFFILFELLQRTNVLSRRAAGMVALLLAIMSMIFLPPLILVATGAVYATVVGIVMLGVGFIAIFWIWWWAGNQFPGPTGWILRVLVALIGVYVSWVVTVHANNIMDPSPLGYPGIFNNFNY